MRTRTPFRLFCQKARLLSGLALAVLLSGQVSAARVYEDQRITPSDGAEYDTFGVAIGASHGVTIFGARQDSDDNSYRSGSAYLYNSKTGSPIRKLTASDAQDSEYFGSSVATDGTTAIVGAWGSEVNGTNSGAAYLFDVATGNQRVKLTPPSGAYNDYFGSSVAVGNGVALVGASGNDDRTSGGGAAYLFNSTTGRFIDKLLPSSLGYQSQFGVSAAINGNRAIVGSNGGAYLYDTTTRAELGLLTPTNGTYSDQFGMTVAINSQYALVGAQNDGDGGSQSGAAYLFDLDTGEQIFKLTADDASDYDYFGSSVAINDGFALIGAYAEDEFGGDAGAAYLFDLSTGLQVDKLIASDGDSSDNFGNALALDGGMAIIGAWHDGPNGYRSGSAYLFTVAEVPEPTTAMLVLVGMSLLLGGSSRRRVH